MGEWKVTDNANIKEAERLHLESELKSSHTFDQSPISAAIVSLDNRFMQVNEEMCRFTGYSSDELLGMKFTDITHPDDIDLSLENVKKLVNGSIDLFKIEKRYIRKDDTVAVGRVSIRLIKDPSGKPLHFLAMIEDITEQKLAEEKQRQSETFLRNIFECIQDGISILDKDLNILRVNPIMEKWYGPGIIGKKCYQAYHGRREPCEACPSIMALREKTTQTGAVHDRRGWSELYVFPLVNDKGEVTGVIEHVRDIDERKKAERALEESEEKYRFLVENSKDIIWKLDLQGRWTFASSNAEKITGYTVDEILRKTVWDIIAPECHELLAVMLSKRIRGEENPPYELMAICKDGHYIPLDVLSTPVRDKDGKVVGIQGISRDITLRKQSEKELRSAKAQAELYVDLMGHDINNMNQVGIGFLDLALDMLDLDENGRSIISRSRGALESSSQLIDKVRKLQRARSGELSSQKIDLGQTLSNVWDYYSSIQSGNASIDYTPVTGCKVKANELLYDVFSNIVDNALKHAIDKPAITIRLEEVGGYDGTFYKVSIDDNGKGVPDELKSQIFDRFHRGNTKAKGKGLGLYLVKTLVESYNGRVWVEDRVPGDHRKGARFVVMLPAVGK
jgi:PAS domain S-box-containing protein